MKTGMNADTRAGTGVGVSAGSDAAIERMAPVPLPATPVAPRGWYALTAGVATGDMVTAVLAGERHLVYRGRSGRLYVIDPFCPRRGCPLAGGEVVGDGVRCPVDGLLWYPEGARHDPPAAEVQLPVRPVAQIGGLVFTAVGPDPAPLPPDVTGTPDWSSARAHPGAVLECLTAPELLSYLLGSTFEARSGQVDPDGSLRLELDLLGPDGADTAVVRSGGPGWVSISLPDPVTLLVTSTPTGPGELELYAVGGPGPDGMLDRLVSLAESMTHLERSSLPGPAGDAWALIRGWSEGSGR